LSAATDQEFTAFVHARGLAFARLATLLAGDWTAGEDLLQSVLEKTYLRWSRGDGIDNPEAYVRAALANSARSLWRRRSRRPERLMDQTPEVAVADGQAPLDERQALLGALAELSAQQRTVIVLRYFEELTEAEIAAVLGCSTGTVKKQASRAIQRLRFDHRLAATFDALKEITHD
jgi:RNA polymerase sigma-70 factor (sigma-E family)